LKKAIIFFLIITIIPLFASVEAIVQEFNDQISSGIADEGTALISSPTQTFIPTVDNLVAVEIGIIAFTAQSFGIDFGFPIGVLDGTDIGLVNGGDVTVSIFDDLNNLLGSSTLTLNTASAPNEVRFDFIPPISLTPGETYKIQTSVNSPSIFIWAGDANDVYPSGMAAVTTSLEDALLAVLPSPFNGLASFIAGFIAPSILVDVEDHFFLTIYETEVNPDPEENQVIGGEIIPIESTSLILAGTQSFSWMIPVTLSVIGIGLFVVSRKSENS